MNDQLIDNSLIKKSNECKQSSSTPLTEIADSGIVSRITPLSSVNDNNKLFINSTDDDNESIATENQCLSFNLTNISKRMIRFFFVNINFSIFLFSAVLIYKKCEEYMQYPNCLITHVDHPSAIFIQILQDGSAFQQMHQDMK
jgi:hypothetical protein